nr:immunoglobulin heavy chain junction region [Homo sapiens]
QMNSLRVEDTA